MTLRAFASKCALNWYLGLALTLRGEPIAVPEKRPAKLLTLSWSVKFWPVI